MGFENARYFKDFFREFEAFLKRFEAFSKIAIHFEDIFRKN
jgi:hypothetical protein